MTVLDIKSASLDLLAVHLKTASLPDLAADLAHRFADGSPFRNEPVLLDFAGVDAAALDYRALVGLMVQHGMKPIGARNLPVGLEGALHHAGLIRFDGDSRPIQQLVPPERKEKEEAPQPKSLVIDRPVRAGQQIYAKDGDLVVLAMVSAGAELIADGSIHVYAPLRGRALAGARGNREARIFTQAMEAELVSIAGIYRTLEDDLPSNIAGKPSQIRLDADKLVISALSA